jgi:hypothetical protein
MCPVNFALNLRIKFIGRVFGRITGRIFGRIFGRITGRAFGFIGRAFGFTGRALPGAHLDLSGVLLDLSGALLDLPRLRRMDRDFGVQAPRLPAEVFGPAERLEATGTQRSSRALDGVGQWVSTRGRVAGESPVNLEFSGYPAGGGVETKNPTPAESHLLTSALFVGVRALGLALIGLFGRPRHGDFF